MSSGSLVYPSLPVWAARERLETLAAHTGPVADLRAGSEFDDPAAGWYATGQRVGAVELGQLRRLIWDTADAAGFPGRTGRNLTMFDQTLPGPLHDRMRIAPARAGDAGVWAFLALVLVPDIGVWRYGHAVEERLLGGHRNVLRRLWLRAEILGGGPEDPPARMGEDQLVAILERPDALGRERRLARAFARAVLRHIDATGGGGMVLTREAAKRVSRLTAWMLPGALDERDLDVLMDATVRETASALGGGTD